MRVTDDLPRAELIRTVYAELRTIAARCLADERDGHTLQPTALVHEVFLRLRGREDVNVDASRQFYRAAANAMRRILIDHARARGARCRGGGRARMPLDIVDVAESVDFDTIVAVDDAIERLAEASPRTAEIVRLRFYAGLTEPEVARALEVSERTVRREWVFAKAWLVGELE